MKVRQGFVSNSSSSSFMVKMEDLTGEQIYQIKNHREVDENLNLYCGSYGEDGRPDSLNFAWTIEEKGKYLTGYVDMDNFDMEKFMKLIGVDMETVDIDWGW